MVRNGLSTVLTEYLVLFRGGRGNEEIRNVVFHSEFFNSVLACFSGLYGRYPCDKRGCNLIVDRRWLMFL